MGSGWWRSVVFETDFHQCFRLCYKHNLRLCLQYTDIDLFSIGTIRIKCYPWVNFVWKAKIKIAPEVYMTDTAHIGVPEETGL